MRRRVQQRMLRRGISVLSVVSGLAISCQYHTDYRTFLNPMSSIRLIKALKELSGLSPISVAAPRKALPQIIS